MLTSKRTRHFRCIRFSQKDTEIGVFNSHELMETNMKKYQGRYSLILSMLCAGVAQATFTPNPLVTVASEGVKPRVMLILDNSGSMGWSCRTVANHPTASCLIDAESLYESVVDLANTYREDAYFGIANIEQNMTKPHQI